MRAGFQVVVFVAVPASMVACSIRVALATVRTLTLGAAFSGMVRAHAIEALVTNKLRMWRVFSLQGTRCGIFCSFGMIFSRFGDLELADASHERVNVRVSSLNVSQRHFDFLSTHVVSAPTLTCAVMAKREAQKIQYRPTGPRTPIHESRFLCIADLLY